MKTVAITLFINLFGVAISPEHAVDKVQSINRLQTISLSMEQQTEQTVRNFLTAVQGGDFPKAISLLHPNVTWNQPGDNRFSGLKSSRDELVQMIGGMTQFSAHSLRLTNIDRLSVNGNRVACVLHWQAVQEAGARLDVDNIDVYTVKDGLITEATIYSANIQQENAFWSK